jgi:hypothetical protein
MTAVSTTTVAGRTRSFDLEEERIARRWALRAATYVEFLLGHGEAPGVDLGSPVHFQREGSVYSQRFARGLTLANVGDEACEVVLERPYVDLAGRLRTSIVLPARSAEVLRLDASRSPLPGEPLDVARRVAAPRRSLLQTG